MSKVKNVIPLESKKEEIKEINLSKFAKELENKSVSHAKNERETIYIYPASIPKERINEKEGKQFRGKLRAKIQRFSNNAFFYAKSDNQIELKKLIVEFDANYKEFYRINDYSLKSLSSSNDPAKNKDCELLLQIIKEMKSI
jgi:hypothetical protein